MLILPEDQRERLEAFVTAGYPHETCGVLVGRVSGAADDPTGTVVRVEACANLDTERARDRYDLDPDDFLRADRAARAEGLEIVGIWHSHPDHPARPSETDRSRAWEGWSYLIASVTADGVADLASWRLDGGVFRSEPLQIRESVSS